MTLAVSAMFGSLLKETTPSEGQRQLASSYRESLEAWLRQDLDIVRMRETGSWHHGTAVTVHSDVDYFVTMPWPQPNSSYDALEPLRASLSRGVSNAFVRIDRPAVRLTYFDDGPAVEITPAYYMDADDYQIPDPDGSGWVRSNPAVHLGYVNEAQQKTNGKAKSLVRLVKTWKALNNVPLSSFYLEMRVAKYAQKNEIIVYDWDLRDFFKELASGDLSEMNDPTHYGRRIATGASGLTDSINAKYAIEEAARLATLAKEAKDAGDQARAVNHWAKLFNLRG